MNPRTSAIDIISHSRSFETQLDDIISRTPTPDTIDSYVDDALADVVELTQQVRDAYGQFPIADGMTAREHEDLSYEYFGLTKIESILDHLSDLSESTRALDGIIDNATQTYMTIVPTEPAKMEMGHGNGTLEGRVTHSRLKTVLFVLEQQFKIDVHDPERLQLLVGETDTTVRSASYYLLNVPEVERALLVCDESGNASYVFDTELLQQLGKDAIDLTELRKQDLDELLTKIEGVGTKIIYSPNFTSRIAETIINPLLAPHSNKSTEEYHFLTPPLEEIPAGHLFTKAIAEALSLSPNTITKAVAALSETADFGEIIRRNTGNGIFPVFSPDQQNKIYDYLVQEGIIIEKSLVGYLPTKALGKALAVSSNTITKAVAALSETADFGEIIRRKKGNRLFPVFSPDQQIKIAEWVSANKKKRS